MSLFHKLQDVYFDAVRLGEGLSRIPSQCDCPEELRLNGRCCCANEEARLVVNAGCLEHVNRLRNDIDWLREDLQREKRLLQQGEMSEDLVRQIFSIESSLRYLGTALDRVRDRLTQSRAKCAHELLARLKESGEHLRNSAAALNYIL